MYLNDFYELELLYFQPHHFEAQSGVWILLKSSLLQQVSVLAASGSLLSPGYYKGIQFGTLAHVSREQNSSCLTLSRTQIFALMPCPEEWILPKAALAKSVGTSWPANMVPSPTRPNCRLLLDCSSAPGQWGLAALPLGMDFPC